MFTRFLESVVSKPRQLFLKEQIDLLCKCNEKNTIIMANIGCQGECAWGGHTILENKCLGAAKAI